MRLHDSRGPNPQIVRTFAAEKGISLQTVAVDVMRGENREAAFRALNPMGQLPALELPDGAVVTEATAICELLEELNPHPALIGETANQRAESRMWVRRIDLMVLEPFMLGFRATAGRAFFQPRMQLLSESAGQDMLGLLSGNLTMLDQLLAGRDFVCGDRFTLADITLGCFLRFGSKSGAPLPDGVRFLPGWLQRLDARGTFSA